MLPLESSPGGTATATSTPVAGNLTKRRGKATHPSPELTELSTDKVLLSLSTNAVSGVESQPQITILEAEPPAAHSPGVGAFVVVHPAEQESSDPEPATQPLPVVRIASASTISISTLSTASSSPTDAAGPAKKKADDDGWQVVSKKKTSGTVPTSSGPAASGPLTKKQRENQSKAAKAKALKQLERDEQERRLQAYRREQEADKLAAPKPHFF
ncbi:hypothetical protein HDV03_003757 [Kappamyces sp. JEL0829]|nr:hypothetical protein HDV03_003757 [Kappamyces sp. JEL0829]